MQIKDVKFGKTERKSYAKYPELLKMPNLLKIQKEMKKIIQILSTCPSVKSALQTSDIHAVFHIGLAKKFVQIFP